MWPKPLPNHWLLGNVIGVGTTRAGWLGALRFSDRRVVFLEHLHLEVGKFGHLLVDHTETALNMLAQIL